MWTELVLLDDRAMCMDGKSAEPFGTDVLIPLLEREVLGRTNVEVGEMKEETHVKRLPDRAELLHQRMIETDEMLVLQ